MTARAPIEDVSDLVLVALFAHEKAGGRRLAGITRLQKLLFLATQSQTYRGRAAEGRLPTVEFEPYRMGPFSPEVYDAIQVLTSFTPPLINASASSLEVSDDIELARYVDELDLDRTEPAGSPARPTTFELTEDGRKVAKWIWSQLEVNLQSEFEDVETRFGRLPLRELLRYVYAHYPTMTTRSEIKGQLGLEP